MTSGSSGNSYRRSIFPQPFYDLLARPVMIVVEMQNDRVERQPLVAADGTSPAHVLEAVEQSIETRPHRRHFAGQRVCALVCRAERARSTVVGKIRAERLRPALRARSDRFGELELIFAGHLVHDSLPSLAFYASTWRPAPVRKRPLCVAC